MFFFFFGLAISAVAATWQGKQADYDSNIKDSKAECDIKPKKKKNIKNMWTGVIGRSIKTEILTNQSCVFAWDMHVARDSCDSCVECDEP